MAIVKVYMSETEKEILSSLALSFGMSLSQYVKHELGDIRPEDISIENNNSSSKRTISIRIRVTPEEYDLIKNKAAERPLSSYGRKMMLTGGHPIRIFIYTDDMPYTPLFQTAQGDPGAYSSYTDYYHLIAFSSVPLLIDSYTSQQPKAL